MTWLRVPSANMPAHDLNFVLRKSMNFEAPSAGALQIDKDLQKDGVVDLVEESRLAIVLCLHLIAKIHIELFRELAIHTEKKSVFIES